MTTSSVGQDSRSLYGRKVFLKHVENPGKARGHSTCSSEPVRMTHDDSRLCLELFLKRINRWPAAAKIESSLKNAENKFL